ncbi:MAG: type II secretion system F family protein [Ignavibacteriales bacterium]|nr:type II secretion system F family protein [Ignavibacteriales bacterium]
MRGTEYRIQAVNKSGKPVQRVIFASSFLGAREKANEFARSLGLSRISIRKKKNFSYRVRRGNNIIDGVQSAYSKSEVVSALKQLGFEVRFVRRHFDIQFEAPANELVSFIGTSARLLEQKMPYHEILQIMSGNVRNKQLKGAIRAIIKDLKEGTDSREAFIRQSKVFGKETALMLGIASKSGDMKSIFESVAHFVERQADFKKGLASSLILPAVTSLSLVGAIGFYVLYLLPEMVKLLGPMAGELPPLTTTTLEISEIIKENLLLLTLAFFALLGGFYAWLTTSSGQYFFDKLIVRIPYIGRILQNTSVEMYCRVLGIMYTSSQENIDAIQHAAEASRNHFLEKQIRTVAIPAMLKYGTEFAKAMEMTRFFPEMALSRFRTAAETGDVKGTALQLADFYELENRYAMKNLISIIEVSISLIIMVAMVFLTFLSSETASIKIEGIP